MSKYHLVKPNNSSNQILYDANSDGS